MLVLTGNKTRSMRFVWVFGFRFMVLSISLSTIENIQSATYFCFFLSFRRFMNDVWRSSNGDTWTLVTERYT